MVSREDIESEIIRFYKQLYTGGDRDRPQLDGVEFKQISPHSSLLIEGFVEEEIKEAIVQFRKDKAPGLDGFPIVFFGS